MLKLLAQYQPKSNCFGSLLANIASSMHEERLLKYPFRNGLDYTLFDLNRESFSEISRSVSIILFALMQNLYNYKIITYKITFCKILVNG